jgi:hypothetical protein
MKWKCENCKYSFEITSEEQAKVLREVLPIKINDFGNPQCTVCAGELTGLEVEIKSSAKETVLHYCRTVQTHDIHHLQNCLDNEKLIEKCEYRQMSGCPSSYGLDNHVGLCEIEAVGDDIKKGMDQCEACWKQALGAENEVPLVTDKQHYAINMIENNLGIKFAGTTKEEARIFIGEHYERSKTATKRRLEVNE